MANDKDDRVHIRQTDSRTVKGTGTSQSYHGASGRVVKESSTGVGVKSTATEDKGLVLKFRIPIQSKNPVVRI